MMKNNTQDWVIFVLAIVILQLLVDLVSALDIPVARQVLCFIYLTFLPGVVLLRLFGTYGLNSMEKFLFSIGLSVAFILFLGLIVNQIGLSFKFPSVLSAPFLMLATNFAVFFLCILVYFFNRNVQPDNKRLSFSLRARPPWVLTICFPLLAIFGTTLVNFNGNSVILLLMIGLIALTILVTSVRARTHWPLILLMITIAVLFHTSLISNYIIGFDIHPAYHVFKFAQSRGIWDPSLTAFDPTIPRTNQMLSVTIFPTTYSNMLNLEGTWIFKIVYPMIFALVPVGLYYLYQKNIEKKTAFAAAIVILADITFFAEMPGLPTQMIGEFFLVLSLIVTFNENLNPVKKIIFFTIFSAGIIVSHYGISYIFMFLILFAWLFSFIRKKTLQIKTAYVILFFVMAFSWYVYTCQSASFASLIDMGENIYRNVWTDLLNPQSRAEQSLRGVGIGEPATSWGHWLGRGFHYAIQFFIVLGVVSVVLKRKTGYKLSRDYVVMSIAMLIFVALPLLVPSFNLLNIPRMYHISLLFLAPFCIMGGNSFFSFSKKFSESRVPFILTLIAVVSLLLFETGFNYEVTGDVSYSVPLSMHRMSRAMVYGNGYVTERVDVAGAQWLHSNFVFSANTLIYADIVSINQPLTSYAVLPRDHTAVLFNITSFDENTYVYLRNFNTFDGKIVGMGWNVWNTTSISPRFEALDRIYTNGGSEVFFTPSETCQ